jgi:endoplasmic reticulum junction formation protein lunapark
VHANLNMCRNTILILQKKAASASVLASEMGAETGLKVSMGDEAKSECAQARSSNVELRNPKETKGKGSSQGSTTLVYKQQKISNEPVSAGMESNAVFKSCGSSQSYALICGNCHMHSGTYGIS